MQCTTEDSQRILFAGIHTASFQRQPPNMKAPTLKQGLLGAAAILVLLVIIFMIYLKVKTTPLKLTSITIVDKAASIIAITSSLVDAKAKSDPSTWNGKRIRLSFKSIGAHWGKIAATPVVTGGAISFPVTLTSNLEKYEPDAGDTAIVY